MKANWKVALMCLSILTFVAACNDKNPASDPGTTPSTDTIPGGGGTDTIPGGGTDTIPGGGGEEEYTSPIKINDRSIADWEALDQTKVAVFEMPEDPLYTAMKKIMVYADKVYINYVIFFDSEELTSRTPNDGMHIYMDADNSDTTGGYWDQFDGPNQGNTDLMFEGAIFGDNGENISYSPSVSIWAGELNGEGWLWEELPSASNLGASQFVGDNIIEGRLVKQYIPWDKWGDQFSIGFDMQQNWESVGLLPQANTPDGELIGRSKKLLVTFDK